MIKNQTVSIIINKSNKKKYNDLGYQCNVGDIIEIQILHLNKSSEIKINVICDKCNKERKIEFKSLVGNNYLENYTCRECKREENLINKYGVKNVFQLDSTKEKAKQTIQKKYHVEYITQNDDIKNKIKNTNKNKYGVDYFLSNKLIREKIKNTVISKYGVDNISKMDDIKIKKENTCLKNHGVKIISQHNRFKDLIKDINIIKLSEKYELNFLNINEDSFFFKCDKCDKEYEISKKVFYTRIELQTILCTKCNPVNSFSNSGYEIQLQFFIKENYNKEIVLNSRKIIYPYELDIYLPDLKLAIEFNGLFWHNELGVDNSYHLNKTEMCEELGIHLIHIYEDDWIYKQDIVKSQILNLLGKTPNNIFDIKFVIKEILDNDVIKDFLEINHIHGFIESQIKLGLYYNDELVSLMIFKKQKKNIYEMLRFCDKLNTSVVGDKLFKYFVDNYNPVEIISYADRSWSQGKLYKALGFIYVNKIKPKYYYIINGHRKDKSDLDSQNRKIYRIYDSGSLKFIWKK